jgi:glycosyltransferase involved in cell wall biosynthesis
MRIGIDSASALGDRGGVGWHTYHLVRALVELKEDVELICYLPPGGRSRLPAELAVWEQPGRLRWVEAGRATLRWRARLDQLDLYHGPNFKMRARGKHGGLVTIHDLWLDRHPEFSPKLFGQRASFHRTKRTVWRARRVITVSRHSARDIEELYGVSRDRIEVIPNGVSEDFCPAGDPSGLADLRARFTIPTERYLLFVGGADPRKNHQTLLRAYARVADLLPAHSLVLVGDVTHRFGDIRQTARTFGIEARTVCPGRLATRDMQALYAHADVFVFPSLYEGFGMPVLEAMACGAPVITSSTTSLPEVAGDAAIQVHPEDVEALADAIVRVTADAGLQDALRAAGLERVKLFSWKKAAERTLGLYRAVCRNETGG